MPAFKRILCPVDLSEESRHAVRLAAAIASWAQAELTLQYVYVPLSMPVQGLVIPADRIALGELDRVSEQVRDFGAAAGCPATTMTATDVGHPAFEILKRAGQDKVDLIVMGTHGASGFTHLVLGSVTEKVLRQAPCPVLTVPPGAPPAPTVPFRHIVCAVDFSEWSLAALDIAVSLANEGPAAVTAVHVIEWPWPEPPAPAFGDLPPAQASALLEFRRYASDRAASRLSDSVRTAAGDRCDVAVEVVHGKTWVELLRVAATKQADLVAIGVHARSMLDLAMFGSTANQVVRHATCPVLTVRR